LVLNKKSPTKSEALHIELLTSISKQIWESPNYERKPYTNQLYKTNDNRYYWEIENGVEITCIGNSRLNIGINYVVDIIQILKHLNK